MPCYINSVKYFSPKSFDYKYKSYGSLRKALQSATDNGRLYVIDGGRLVIGFDIGLHHVTPSAFAALRQLFLDGNSFTYSDDQNRSHTAMFAPGTEPRVSGGTYPWYEINLSFIIVED